ncbi:hypothetical protein [Streptomyces sp. NPDC094049]|uniref:hypothetical protein n=1 Tax=Streptomyces sp. NPDC094049 TaxID=3154987 RepID=UPI00331BE6BB
MSGQAQLRVRDRLDEVVAACVAVLLAEAVIGLIVNYVWGQTAESPALPMNSMGLFMLVVGSPFLVAGGAMLATAVAATVVVPVICVAAWLGRVVSGREVWWWVPAAAAILAVGPGVAVTVLTDGGVLAGFVTWVAGTAALAAPALTARRLLLPARRRPSLRTVLGSVGVYGTLAVVTAFTLAGIALHSGIAYEPPRFNAQQLTGTYTDGDGGTLTLAPDGRADADRIRTFDYDDTADSFGPRVRECSGTGTWTHDPAHGPLSQQVLVTFDSCPMDSWNVYGTLRHPKLYLFIGDPDSGEIYTLRRG